MQLGIPSGITIAHQFPLAITDGTIEVMVKVQRVRATEILAVKGWLQANAFQRLDFVSCKFLRMLNSRNIHAGGHEIDEVSGLALEPAVVLGVDALGPMGNQRRRDAAFVRKVFVFAKWCIGHIRPASAHTGEGILCPCHGVGPVFHRATTARLHWRPDLGLKPVSAQCLIIRAVRSIRFVASKTLRARAVVLQIKNQRVVQGALPLKFRHNAADALIHVIDHRRVHLHVTNIPFLVGRLFPFIRACGNF